MKSKKGKEPGEGELWARHRAGERAAYDRLVEHYLPLVKVAAGRLALHLPSFIREEDLYSAGCVGLLAAVENFDPERDVRFETYALSRIRGSMLDDLRATDVLTRAVRERASKIRQAERDLREEGKPLSPQAVAELAGLSMEDLCDTERSLHMAAMTSLDDAADEEGHTAAALVVDENADSPLETLERQELLALLKECMDEKDKLLVVLYYHEELTLREIGQILGVSESRVSQMHTEMVKRLQYRLEAAGHKRTPKPPKTPSDGPPKPPPAKPGSGEWLA